MRFLWDYNINEENFQKILAGKLTLGRIDKKWAITRLLEYGSYSEIIHLLGFKGFTEEWPEIREYVRSPRRKRGFDFLHKWLVEKHKELI
jgi:hypothetical protein